MVAAIEAPESVTANASPRDVSNRLATALVHTVACNQRFAKAMTDQSTSQFVESPVAVSEARTNRS